MAGVPDGADDTVAAREKLIGEFATEAAADPGYEPGALFHGDFHINRRSILGSGPKVGASGWIPSRIAHVPARVRAACLRCP